MAPSGRCQPFFMEVPWRCQAICPGIGRFSVRFSSSEAWADDFATPRPGEPSSRSPAVPFSAGSSSDPLRSCVRSRSVCSPAPRNSPASRSTPSSSSPTTTTFWSRPPMPPSSPSSSATSTRTWRAKSPASTAGKERSGPGAMRRSSSATKTRPRSSASSISSGRAARRGWWTIPWSGPAPPAGRRCSAVTHRPESGSIAHRSVTTGGMERRPRSTISPFRRP